MKRVFFGTIGLALFFFGYSVQAQSIASPDRVANISTPSLVQICPTVSQSVTLAVVESVASFDLKATTGNQSVTEDETSRSFDVVYTHTYPLRESFLYPSLPGSKYPNIDIQGFWEARLSGRNFEPKNATDSRWETIRRDPVYTKIPNDVLVGNPRLDLRYRFDISGQLEKELAVFYNVEQEPDFPGRYDIRVKYKNTDITFFQFDAQFKQGEYINVKKALNGAKIQTVNDDWEILLASGKLRSEPQKFSGFGNGSQKISLGARSILEDSLKVWVNNVSLVLGRDYDVNYFTGEVTFKSSKGPNDYILAIYEFTNPIGDFIPVLNRKNFNGGQFSWRTKIAPKEVFLSTKIDKEELKSVGSSANTSYSVANVPVVLGSETVRLNGQPLRRDKDYFLKNQKGKLLISHQLQLNPADQLTIGYDFYQVESVKDILIGKNSIGPYALSRPHVLEDGVDVYVGLVKMVEMRDYTFDNARGRLLFTYPIPYPSVITVEYRALRLEVTYPTATDISPFTLGVTYLSEYTQADQQNLINRAPTETYTLSATRNVLKTTNTPLVNLDKLSLFFNNSRLTTANYQVLNPYTGEIALNPILGPGTVKVSYAYRQSFRTSYVIQGKNIGGLPYKNREHFFLRDLPIKYKGIAYIRILGEGILGEQLLNEGREFSVDYGTTGQDIAISFFVTSQGTGSTLTNYPNASHRMTLVYDYTPPDLANQGVLSQSVTGIAVSSKLTDNWDVAAEIALSDHNYSKPQQSFTCLLPGTGVANTVYDLGKRGVVENTEAVYLNNIRQNKDSDYVINYPLGTLTLINKTPRGSDTLRVDAKFYDTSAGVVAGESQVKTAMRLNTTYQADSLTVKGDFKSIDKDFLPIGDIREQKGSTVLGGSVNWKIDDHFLNADYHHRDVYVGKSKDNVKDIFLRLDEYYAGADLHHILGSVDTKQTLHFLTEVQDPDPSSSLVNVHAVDNFLWDYSGSLLVGPEDFRQTITRGFSEKTTDFLDKINPTKISTERTRWDSVVRLTKLPILGDLGFFPYFEFSKANSEEFYATGSVLASKGIRYDARTNYGLKSSLTPVAFLPIGFSYDRQEVRSKLPLQATENLNVLTNLFFNMGFTPFSWFLGDLSMRHTEAESPLVNQQGSVEDARSYQISRFSPQLVPSLWGVSDTYFLLAPLHGSFFAFSSSLLSRKENNAQRSFDSELNRFSFSSFEPIDGIRLQSISFENSFSKSLNKEGSSTVSYNRGQSDMVRHELSATFFPRIPFFNLFQYTFSMENRLSTLVNDDVSLSGTSNRLTDLSPYFRRNQQLSFNPGSIVLPLLFGWEINFGKLTASLQESLEDRVNSKKTIQYPRQRNQESTVTSLIQDNSYIQQYNATLGLSPFSIFNLNTSAKLGQERYSRNLNKLATGTTYKDLLGITSGADYTPFSFMRWEASGSYSDMVQFRSSTLDTPKDILEKGLASQDFSNLIEHINSRQISEKLTSILTPFSWFSITSSGEFVQILERLDTIGGNTRSQFNQKIGSSGAIFRPFDGVSIAYNYSLKLTDDNVGNVSQGYGGVTTVSYLPIQLPGFKVTISYVREDSWGIQLNNLDKQVSQQSNGYTVSTQIINRDDIVETASLSIDISIPITDSPYLDSVVISGEGSLKKVTDRLDWEKPDKRSYEISGFILKGTLMF